MAKLSKREQRLFFGFVLTLFLAACWYLWKFYSSHRDHAIEQAHQLNLREAEYEVLLEERDKWTQRSEWLAAYQPAFTSRADIDQAIADDMRASGFPGVETQFKRLIETHETPDYIQAGVEFAASGKLEDVFAWLHTLQRPENFRVIRSLRVLPDKDDPELVVCEIELLRWYRPSATTVQNP
ncbi:MAG: hypothetical protein AAF585_02110 [Verrucomicrobiota bacterium]